MCWCFLTPFTVEYHTNATLVVPQMLTSYIILKTTLLLLARVYHKLMLHSKYRTLCKFEDKIDPFEQLKQQKDDLHITNLGPRLSMLHEIMTDELSPDQNVTFV